MEISGSQVGFKHEYISARSMQEGVTMVLLITRVEMDIIKLVGRWRSDIMMCYLHTSDQTFTAGLTARMVQHGDYVLILHTHGG